jgi:hypothetical protein
MNVAAPVIAPAIVAGLLWLVAGQLWKRPAAPGLVWGGSLAIAVSFFAGHVALMGWPPFPPVTATHSLVYAGLIVGVVGIAETRWRSHWAVRWIIRAVIAAAAAWMQFGTLVEHTWTGAQTLGWVTTVILTVCVVWDSIDTLASRRQNVATPLMMWLIACASSVALVFGASAMLGQLAGCVAAACGAAVVLAIWSRSFPLDRGAAGLFAFIIVNLLWQGNFYAELPIMSITLLILAPVAGCTIDLVIRHRAKPFYLLTIVFGSVILLSSVGIGIAYVAYQSAAIEMGDYAY